MEPLDEAAEEPGRPLARQTTADLVPAAERAPGPGPGPAPLALGGDLTAQVRTVRALSTVRPGTTARRALFMWLRIFVDERKPNGKQERVNVRIPIPLPLLGLLLPWRMSGSQAMKLLADAYAAGDPLPALQRGLDGYLAFEFVRVEETNPATGKTQLVVIGLE
jgi:hypothetical protein